MTVRVLVVDDEESIRHLIRINLTLEGFEVRTAEDGETALLLAQEFLPHVVTLDVMMPGLSGLEVAQRLLADPQTAAIRIVLVSARAQRADLERGAQLGAHAYLTKPFDPDDLVALVRELATEQ